VNIKCVNAVGIDLNLVIDHDHMHILLSFLSFFGPRKAKQFISDLKSKGIKLLKRSDLYNVLHQGKHLYLYSSAFMKLRLTAEDKNIGAVN
jgi:transcriptional accessory protein Tex/SPT6